MHSQSKCRAAAFIVMLATMTTAGCGSGTPSSVLAKVIVAPDPASVELSKSISFTAQGRDSRGAVMAVSPVWTVKPDNLGQIAPDGLFTATQTGNGRVLATCGTITGYAEVIVTAKPHNLTISIVGSGSVSRDPEAETYNHGSICTIRAVPSKEWHFDAWDGDVTGTSNPVHLVMDYDKNITAVFKKEYTASGRVAFSGTGEPVKDCILTFSSGFGRSVTDSRGEWSKSGLYGNVSVTPSMRGYVLQPAQAELSCSGPSVDFIAIPTTEDQHHDPRG